MCARVHQSSSCCIICEVFERGLISDATEKGNGPIKMPRALKWLRFSFFLFLVFPSFYFYLLFILESLTFWCAASLRLCFRLICVVIWIHRANMLRKYILRSLDSGKLSLSSFNFGKVMLSSSNVRKFTLSSYNSGKLTLWSYNFGKVTLSSYNARKFKLTRYNFVKLTLSSCNSEKLTLQSSYSWIVNIIKFKLSGVNFAMSGLRKMNFVKF